MGYKIIKTNKTKFLLALMLILFTGLFAGCEFSFIPSSEPIKISGYVIYQDSPLVDVKIVSDFFDYTITDQNGYYEFTTRSKKLVFYAKKAGYNFIPKTYNIADASNLYNFEAEMATPLSGTLTLAQILISPTSIVSIPRNNFEYKIGDNSYLKVAEFKFTVGTKTSQLLFGANENAVLQKNMFTDLLSLQEIEEQAVALDADGQVNLKFTFMLKAYYQDSSTERISTERVSVFESNSKLDTGDLDENGMVKFSAASINSYNNSFTYNIQFVFQYQQTS